MSNINTELKVIQSASNADAYAVAILVSQGKTLIAAGPLAQGPLAGRVGDHFFFNPDKDGEANQYNITIYKAGFVASDVEAKDLIGSDVAGKYLVSEQNGHYTIANVGEPGTRDYVWTLSDDGQRITLEYPKDDFAGQLWDIKTSLL